MMPTVPDSDWKVRRAVPADLSYLDKLQTRYSNQIGFMPRSWMRQKLQAGRYLLLLIRGQAAAFTCLSGGQLAPVRILQHAVDDELWRQGYGSLLQYAVYRLAARTPWPWISVKLRVRSISEQFAKSLHGQLDTVQIRPTARGKPLAQYTFKLDKIFLPAQGVEGPDPLSDPRFNKMAIRRP